MTSVINASMVGVIDAAKKSKVIDRVFGMRFGIEGVLNNHLIDLKSQSPATMRCLRATPSSALGSSRHKLQESDLGPVLKRLKQFNIIPHRQGSHSEFVPVSGYYLKGIPADRPR